LQETKVQDHEFPLDQLHALGFKFIEICGEKSYNGVAILSRIAFSDVTMRKFAGDSCRHISIKLSNDIELHNFYIPAGGDIPDVDLNPKFANKLQYLDEVTNWFSQNRSPQDKMILVGDLNISPLEHDVWSHKQLLKEVSHTPIEIEKLKKWQNSLNWCDTHREFTPEDQKLYSWWSYRNRDWRKSNRGRRLDHIWVSDPLKSKVTNAWILKDARDWESPSDHVPVLAKFSL
jgi:exodeoxyribonuclease-3